MLQDEVGRLRRTIDGEAGEVSRLVKRWADAHSHVGRTRRRARAVMHMPLCTINGRLRHGSREGVCAQVHPSSLAAQRMQIQLEKRTSQFERQVTHEFETLFERISFGACCPLQLAAHEKEAKALKAALKKATQDRADAKAELARAEEQVGRLKLQVRFRGYSSGTQMVLRGYVCMCARLHIRWRSKWLWRRRCGGGRKKPSSPRQAPSATWVTQSSSLSRHRWRTPSMTRVMYRDTCHTT